MLVAGWLMRILKLAYYKTPYKWIVYNPLYNLNNQFFLNCSTGMHLVLLHLPRCLLVDGVGSTDDHRNLWYTNDISKDNEEDVMYTVHMTFDKTISS